MPPRAGARGVDGRRVLRVFAQLMAAAQRDKLIHESPCRGVRVPRANRAAFSLTVLTVEHVIALADEVPARYRALPARLRRARPSPGRSLRAHGRPSRLPTSPRDHRPASRHTGDRWLPFRAAQDVGFELVAPAARRSRRSARCPPGRVRRGSEPADLHHAGRQVDRPADVAGHVFGRRPAARPRGPPRTTYATKRRRC